MGPHYNTTPVAIGIPFDNTNNSFTATDAQSAIEEARTNALAVAPVYFSATGTSTVTTSSATFSIISGMSVSPTVSGDYLAIWSGQFDTGNTNGSGETAIFVNGSQQTALTHQTQLDVSVVLGILGVAGSTEGASNIIGKVSVTAGQNVDVRFRSLDGNTMTIQERSLVLIRIFDPGLIGSAQIVGTEHASTHLPGGSDPITTAVAFSTGTANAEGTANSLSRSDHIHNTVIANQFVSATATTTTTSNTATNLNSMTLTVAVSGTYKILGNVVWVAAGNNTGVIGLYNNGTLITGTNGSYARNANNPMTYSGQTIVSLTAGDVVTIRWNTSGGQTMTANLRSLSLVRLG